MAKVIDLNEYRKEKLPNLHIVVGMDEENTIVLCVHEENAETGLVVGLDAEEALWLAESLQEMANAVQSGNKDENPS